MSILLKRGISRDSGVSLGDQVKANLRSRILKHEWDSGAKIPGEFELAKQYGVARVTIRTALRSLETQGLIDIRHGSGAYVADFGDSIRAGLQELKSITQTIKELGFKAGMLTRTSQIRAATKSESIDLLLESDTKVLHIERAITSDGEVVAFSYDTFAVEGLTTAAIKKISTGSVFAGLDAVDKQPVRARAEIHAISSKEIGWGSGKPRNGLYLQLHQVHYLRDGKPIATGDTFFVEGKFQFIIYRTI
ncbi:MAG: GntR family transcriptional regulator [Candidatus Planktophila sp.]|jgi:GntR family transcriptional regulator|tara:strand:+ start:1660 stop:2406 length:747 start_codon:yes stop_codon:yes gene_type:complete